MTSPTSETSAPSHDIESPTPFKTRIIQYAATLPVLIAAVATGIGYALGATTNETTEIVLSITLLLLSLVLGLSGAILITAYELDD